MSASENRRFGFGSMLGVLVVACIIWYWCMPRNRPRDTAPLLQEKPGEVTKGITIGVDHAKSDDEKVRISHQKMPEALKQQKLIRDSLIKNREKLPEKYIAGLLWTETELILVIVPTETPITMDQVHAFVEIIWALEKNLGDHAKRRDVVISDGPLKGGHGVALPLKKAEVPATKPAA